jgi:DNA-binding transcriptional ArsR family regulator
LTAQGKLYNHIVVNELTTTFGALSDPTRRAILAKLKAGPATVSELARPFRMSQQAISKHLARLQQAHLIRKRREGREQICELDPAPMREVAAWIEDYRQYWEEAFGRLHALLQQEADPRESRVRGKGKS